MAKKLEATTVMVTRVPKAPVSAQISGGHVQVLFDEGYISMEGQQYRLSKVDQLKIEIAREGTVPTLPSASGSDRKYWPLIVVQVGPQVVLHVTQEVALPIVLEVNPNATLVPVPVYVPSPAVDEDEDEGDGGGDGEGDDDDDDQ